MHMQIDDRLHQTVMTMAYIVRFRSMLVSQIQATMPVPIVSFKDGWTQVFCSTPMLIQSYACMSTQEAA